MPRKLPWKRAGAAAASRQTPAGSSVPPPFSTAAGGQEAPRRGPDAPNGARPPARERGSPSTSPPPIPQAESFMRDGLDADDEYRMVEDEFLSVAGTFTAHLHKAEYHRLKNLTKNKNAVTIQAISRPVAGNTTEAVKRRQAVLDLASRQTAGLKRARGLAESADEDDSDDGLGIPSAGTALQGLMGSTRPRAVPLSNLVKGSAGNGVATQHDVRLGHSSPSAHAGAYSDRLDGLQGACNLKRTGEAVSSATRGTAEVKHADELQPIDDEVDSEDLDAPSLVIPKQQHNRHCDAPPISTKLRAGGSDSCSLATPLTYSVNTTTTKQMHSPYTASSIQGTGIATPSGAGPTSPQPRHDPVYKAGHSPVAGPSYAGHEDNGLGSDDDEDILRRITERRKLRRAQSSLDARRTPDKDSSVNTAKHKRADVSLDAIPSFL